jgi:hypothetical protein
LESNGRKYDKMIEAVKGKGYRAISQTPYHGNGTRVEDGVLPVYTLSEKGPSRHNLIRPIDLTIPQVMEDFEPGRHPKIVTIIDLENGEQTVLEYDRSIA